MEEADEAPSDLPRPRAWPRAPRPSPPVFLDFAGLTLAGLVAPLLALVVDWGIVVVWNAVVERHCRGGGAKSGGSDYASPRGTLGHSTIGVGFKKGEP